MSFISRSMQMNQLNILGLNFNNQILWYLHYCIVIYFRLSSKRSEVIILLYIGSPEIAKGIIFKCLTTLRKSNIRRSIAMITTNIGMSFCPNRYWRKFPKKANCSANRSGEHWEFSNREGGTTMKSISQSRISSYFAGPRAPTPTQGSPLRDLFPRPITIGDCSILLYTF